MKRILLGLLILAALCAIGGSLLGLSAVRLFAAENGLKGSGRIVSKTISAPDFHTIRASRGVKVVVANTSQSDIRIEADDNVIDFVKVEADKGVLAISIDPSVKRFSSIDVTVTTPAQASLRKLSASSAAKIRCERTLTADHIALEASSAAKIEATIRTKACSVDASSASKIKLTGSTGTCSLETSSASKIDASITCDDSTIEASSASKIALTGSAGKCSAELSSASKLDASEFTVAKCSVETSSGSSAQVRCTETLQARASSGSSIRYSGDCSTEIQATSGSRIRKND